MNNEMFYDPKDNKRFNITMLIILTLLSFFACDKLVGQNIPKQGHWYCVYQDRYNTNNRFYFYNDSIIGPVLGEFKPGFFHKYKIPVNLYEGLEAILPMIDTLCEFNVEDINNSVHKRKSKKYTGNCIMIYNYYNVH